MISRFAPGDTKLYRTTISSADSAGFHGKQVHPVCATFALARDIEWSSRLFVLEMTEEDEEGIGTFLSIEHKSPALVGEMLEIEATVKSWEGNELICTIDVRVGDRQVATGETGQKILKKEKLNLLFERLKQ